MISPLVTLAASKTQKARELEDPTRRVGPSVHEAAEAARELRSEADTLLCDAFYESFTAVGN